VAVSVVPLSPLVGRERELAALALVLSRPAVRLVTLSGPGGVGKTRLALAAAERAAGGFGDGAAIVWLAAVRDLRLVASSIVAALGLSMDPARLAFEQLIGHVRERELLVVLDNFEQVREAGPELVELLGLAPGLKLLVTSRVLLRLSGEHAFPVGPLVRDDAVALFAERARAANGEFDLAAVAGDVGAVCERLDRVPLALELAAARLRVLSPRDLLERLDRRLAYLTGGPEDAPERHRTLRATLDWSYELLPATARELLAALSVFQGGFTVEAAGAVCAPEGVSEVELVDAIGVLVDHSLLQRAEGAPGAGRGVRLWMLETVREYAVERLAARGATDELVRRHADYYLDLAQQGNVGLAGADQRAWFARLEVEQHNLHAALMWTSDGHDRELAVSLAAALGRHYYRFHGDRRENARLIQRAIAGRPQPSSALALAATSLARLETHWDLPAARIHAEQGFAIAAEIHDPGLLAWCSLIRGVVVHVCGEHELAERQFQETIELARAAHDHATEGYATHNLANLALGRADYARASQLCADASPTIAALDSTTRLILTCLQANVSVHVGGGSRALADLRASLPLVENVPPATLSVWLRACGVVLARVGSAERAARLLGQEEVLREGLNLGLDPTDRRELDEAIEILNARLYPGVLESAWRHGRSMSLEEAIAEVATELEGQQADERSSSPAW
jgi:predicted ATPase